MAKIIYYIFIFICSFILILYMISPFGGSFAIVDAIKDGFYNEELWRSLVKDGLDRKKPLSTLNSDCEIKI